MEEKVSVAEMMERLTALPEEAFDSYAFSADPLKHRVFSADRRRLACEARRCGGEYARMLRSRFGEADPLGYAKALGLKLLKRRWPDPEGFEVFAEFLEPDEIHISENVVERASALIGEEGLPGVTRGLRAEHVLIAHELFHYVEKIHRKEIYTKTKRIVLWSAGPFQRRSRLACLSEIAGMAFAKELTGLAFPPYALDVLFTYALDPAAAGGLYGRMLRSFSDPNS